MNRIHHNWLVAGGLAAIFSTALSMAKSGIHRNHKRQFRGTCPCRANLLVLELHPFR